MRIIDKDIGRKVIMENGQIATITGFDLDYVYAVKTTLGTKSGSNTHTTDGHFYDDNYSGNNIIGFIDELGDFEFQSAFLKAVKHHLTPQQKLALISILVN